MIADRHIWYRRGYKYQLTADHRTKTDIVPMQLIDTDYASLNYQGELLIRRGYAWDGPSGMTFDTHDAMRASLVHDALYQLMREKYLDPGIYRERADNLLRSICLEDGMPHVRAEAWYLAVHFGAGPAADPENDRPIYVAPNWEGAPPEPSEVAAP